MPQFYGVILVFRLGSIERAMNNFVSRSSSVSAMAAIPSAHLITAHFKELLLLEILGTNFVCHVKTSWAKIMKIWNSNKRRSNSLSERQMRLNVTMFRDFLSEFPILGEYITIKHYYNVRYLRENLISFSSPFNA